MGTIIGHHQLLMTGGGGAPATYATLNPSDKSANISLSGGNLTATRNSGGGAWSSVRADISKTSGLWYFELKRSAGSATNGSVLAGVMVGTSSLASFPGGISNSIDCGVQLTSPDLVTWRNNVGTTRTGYGAVAVGEYLYIAMDLNSGKVWVKGSAQAGWIGGGDPSLGTTPAFTFISGSAIFPAIGLYDNPASVIANFGASAFSGTVPGGFNPGVYS